MAEQTRRSFLLKSGAAATSVGLAGCIGDIMGGGGSGKVGLGAINPLSGPAAFYGKLATKTQTAWRKKVNEDGGITVGDTKRKVKISEYDDESKNSQARSAAKRLATVDNVAMILSSWRSTGAIAIKPVVNRNKVPTFTHGFTPEVNNQGTYVFRLTVSTVMDAYPALQFVSSNEKIKNIGVIAEQGDWGTDTLNLMKWWFRKTDHGGDFTNLGRFAFNQQDFSSYITKAKNAYNNGEIDALYIQTWASAMQRFLKQQHREGLNEKMPILTGLGGADYNNIGKVGKAMENVYVLGVYTRLSYIDNEQIAKTISKKARSQFKQYKSLDTPMHPTAFNVYADAQATEFALREANSTEGPQLRKALVGTPFTTILGKTTINDRGQPAVPSAFIKFGVNGNTPVVDEVPWSGRLPPITNIPPRIDL